MSESTALGLIQVVDSVEKLQHHERYECVVLGRSNAGKSTLLNRLMRCRLAKVSSAPGKTQTLNLYAARGGHWVDAPGLGYACLSRGVRNQFERRVRDYLRTRKELGLIIHCMDIRHPWLHWDEVLATWCHAPVLYVLTKADKLSRQQRIKMLQRMEQARPGHYITFGAEDDVECLWTKIKHELSASFDGA